MGSKKRSSQKKKGSKKRSNKQKKRSQKQHARKEAKTVAAAVEAPSMMAADPKLDVFLDSRFWKMDADYLSFDLDLDFQGAAETGLPPLQGEEEQSEVTEAHDEVEGKVSEEAVDAEQIDTQVEDVEETKAGDVVGGQIDEQGEEGADEADSSEPETDSDDEAEDFAAAAAIAKEIAAKRAEEAAALAGSTTPDATSEVAATEEIVEVPRLEAWINGMPGGAPSCYVILGTAAKWAKKPASLHIGDGTFEVNLEGGGDYMARDVTNVARGEMNAHVTLEDGTTTDVVLVVDAVC